ncbi:MAG: hypothetical protein GY943_20375 [Chloroflexi bacterium]|nr:hypothetical protein [Chloroflexota bacterium]
MENQPIFIIFIVIAALLAFVGMFSLVSFFVSRVFGWHRIAQQYQGEMNHYRERFNFQSLSTGGFGNYSNVVNFYVSHSDLGISVFFLYRAGHPPLKIPLDEITGVQKNDFIFQRVHLELQRLPEKTLIISKRLAEKIEKASGGAWGFERPLT